MPIHRIDTTDGISWHVETFSSADKDSSKTRHVVLIPSGEGDAGASAPLARQLTTLGYDVITFDMPGFSRSTAPASVFDDISPQLLAKQIVGMLDALGSTQPATFFGCSAGGLAIVGICEIYPERVRAAVVHELPLATPPPLKALHAMSDEQISDACAQAFPEMFVGNREPWDALGTEYHQRLQSNYVTWVRNYVDTLTDSSLEMMKPLSGFKRPFFWTVGGEDPATARHEGTWASNFPEAERLGVEISTTRLVSFHFPGLTIPEATAKYIQECDESALS